MKKFSLCLWLLCAVLVAACGDDDDYHYPSVRLEFLTAQSGSDGYLATVTTDAGLSYAVVQDDSRLKTAADSVVRIISNYEVLSEGVRLYAVGRPVSPFPLPREEFKEGVCTDPVNVLSAWSGGGYINLIVTVRESQGKHSFHFVEESVVDDAATATRTLTLSLYHKTTSTLQDYAQRAYLSVPLAPYTSADYPHLHVRFLIHTYEGEQEFEFDK